MTEESLVCPPVSALGIAVVRRVSLVGAPIGNKEDLRFVSVHLLLL